MTRILSVVLALLLPPSFAFADDAGAADLYKKVSDAFMGARTIHIAGAKTDATDGRGGKIDIESEFWAAGENRYAFQARAQMGKETHDARVVCDGKTVVRSEQGREASRDEADAGASELVRGVLLGGGMMPAMAMMESNADLSNARAADFHPLAEGKVGDRAATVIEYTYHFTAGREEVALGVKLYVDKETLGILRRESNDPNEGLVIAEEYPKVELGTEPPADAFALPPAEPGEPEKPEEPADSPK